MVSSSSLSRTGGRSIRRFRSMQPPQSPAPSQRAQCGRFPCRGRQRRPTDAAHTRRRHETAERFEAGHSSPVGCMDSNRYEVMGPSIRYDAMDVRRAYLLSKRGDMARTDHSCATVQYEDLLRAIGFGSNPNDYQSMPLWT